MYYPFRQDANYKESTSNNPASNLLESGSTGRPFATSFSSQSFSTQSVPGSSYHHGGSIQGLPAVQGSYNIPNMPSVLSTRNSSLSSSGMHQPSGGLSTGRFTSSNLPINLSQLSQSNVHGHNAMSSRGGLNLLGNHPMSGNVSGVGVSGSGIPAGSVTLGTRLTGSGVTSLSQMGGSGTRISTSGTGLNLRSLNTGSATPARLNIGSGLAGSQAPGRAMSPMLQQAASMTSNTYNSSGDLFAMMSRGTSGIQGQMSTVNGQLANLGMGDSNDGMPFDINDFPVLSNRQSSGGLQLPIASFRKQGGSIGQQSQEFSIQNEDFPALPGFKGGSQDIMDLHGKDRQPDNIISSMQSQQYTMGRSSGFPVGVQFVSSRSQQHQLPSSSATGMLASADSTRDGFQLSHGPSASYHAQLSGAQLGTTGTQMPLTSMRPGGQALLASGSNSYDQFLHHQHQQLRGSHQHHLTAIRDIQSVQDMHVSSDQFGLLGLLSIIQVTVPDLTTLALGTDLTTLGLDLNSRENLYKSFASPWADGPLKGEPEFTLPQCYIREPLTLKPSIFRKFLLSTLFYIFYSMPRDEAQIYAANELMDRGWFYHKRDRNWLMRVPNLEPLVKTNVYERGSYVVFDPHTWESQHKDNYLLNYDMLELRPQLPPQPQQS